MINKGYVQVEEIVEGVYQDMGIQSIQWDKTLRWIGRVLTVMGLPAFYIDKATNGKGGNLPPIQIENYRGEIPLDFSEIIVAREFEHKIPMYYSTGIFEEFYEDIQEYGKQICCKDFEIIDELYQDGKRSKEYYNCRSDKFNNINWWGVYKPSYERFQGLHDYYLNYRIENGYIHTNFKEGFVELAYRAYPVDKDFRPLIPNDEKIKRGVEAYIMERLAFNQYNKDRNNQNRNYWKDLQVEYFTWVASARSHANTPDMQQMESIVNNWNRLIPDLSSFEAGHKFNNIEERRKH